MNPFGDGSQGALNVTSGITYLPLNTKLQYTTVNVGASGTIRPSGTTGSVLYICATESITINGTINTSNIVNYGNNTWGVTIDGEAFTSPGTGRGGGATQNEVYFSNGFGQGGANNGNGGSGQPGPSPKGGNGASITRTTNGESNVQGGLGLNSGGQGGDAYTYLNKSSTITATIKSQGGGGGASFGANGGSGSGSATFSGTGSYSYAWSARGGGGAGGRAGRAGVNIVLRSPSVVVSGTIITSGTNGTKGGNGGRHRSSSGWSDTYGYGGGGGGGGSAGNLTVIYNSVGDVSAATLQQDAGAGGAGGVGFISNSHTSRGGENGNDGSLYLVPLVPTADFSSNIQTGPRPLTVGFTNLSKGGDTFSWNFGDSSGSSQENPTHTYTSVGTFTVTLTATNSVGSTTVTKSNYIVTTINDFTRSAGGTFLLGGTTTRRLIASRTAGGTFLLGGTTRAVVIRDAEAIQDKTYLYKVYDPDGNFIEVWKDVADEPQFTHEINSIGSSMTVELARNSDTVGTTTSPILDDAGQAILDDTELPILGSMETRNQIGAGTSVDYNNRVDITAFYGSIEPLYDDDMDEILDDNDEAILTELGAPNGRRIFTGFISEINSRYGNTESTVVQLTSYGFDLDQYAITTAYDNNTTTVAFNSFDPSEIARVAVDRFNQTANLEQVSYTKRTADSIDSTGTQVSYTFRNNTYKEVLDKVLELMPSDWYYRVGLGDNTVYFRERSNTPQHIFYLGKHIKSLDLKGSIIDVTNHVLFTGGGDPALYIEEKQAPAARTRRGLEVLSDSRVTLDTSARIIAQGKIDAGNKMQNRSTIEILAKQYNIEEIQVGHVIGFRNFGNEIDSLELIVAGLSYSPDVVQLALERKPPTVNKRLQDVQRNLTVQENSFLPATPS